MTVNELKQNMELHRQLDRCYEMLCTLQDRTQPGAQVLDGMPRGTDVGDKVGQIAILTADLTDRIHRMENEAAKGDAAVRSFASTFDDPEIQAALQLRFVSCLAWPDIARLFCASTGDSVRMKVYRAVWMRDKQE